MLSEYENNLSAEVPILLDKRGRRVSYSKTKALLMNQINFQNNQECHCECGELRRANLTNGVGGAANGDADDSDRSIAVNGTNGKANANQKWRPPAYMNNRVISVIDEVSSV